MHSVREQYEHMCKRAAQTSAFYRSTLDVVLVRHRNGDRSRVSILGNAINRAMADSWRQDGSNVRLLCTYTNGVRDHGHV